MPKKRNTGLPKITQLPSGAYHAQVYSHTDDNGKRRYESFTGFDYNQVLLQVAQFKADKKREKIEGNKNDLTLGEAMQKYLDIKSAVLSPSTFKSYSGIVRNHFKELQPIPLDKITRAQIQVYVNQISATRSPKTVRNVHAFVTAVFGMFRPDFSLTTTLPQKQKTEMMIPTEEEVKQLLQLTDGSPMYVPIILAACCGMRRSEIAALTWKNVNFKKNTITIDQAMVINVDREFVVKTTKTVAGTRTIRMIPLVADTLMQIKEPTAQPDDHITVGPNSITNNFCRLVRRNGLPEYRFHDLRHYTVSVMLALNIPKKYIADYVGHESENMIDEVYGHIMASKKTSVEDQMQEYFSKFLA